MNKSNLNQVANFDNVALREAHKDVRRCAGSQDASERNMFLLLLFFASKKSKYNNFETLLILGKKMVRSAGIEPTLSAPEANVIST